MKISSHLKKAIKEEKISEVNAAIIASLIEIFDLMHYYDLKFIFEEYKGKYSDEEILFLLRQWIEEGPIPTKIFVKLGDKEIVIQYLQSITLVDSYDTNKKCPIYKIVINKDESEKLLFSNTEIVFYTSEKRQRELDNFKEKTKFLKIKYI